MRRHELLAGALERRCAGQELVGDHAEGVDVAPVIDGCGGDLLRRHVGGRADHDARAGDGVIVGGVGGDRARNAEVGEEHVAAGQQHVVRLDIAMDDARRVRVRERVRDFAEHADGVRDRHRAGAQPAAERFAVDVRHDVEGQIIDGAGIEERKDVRVAKVRRRPDLGDEPIGADDGGQIAPHDFDRDAAIVPYVVREVDGRHAAGAELALDAIARQECCRERWGNVRHALSLRDSAYCA